ncbi:MAG TPA: tripartite tricarboxylate transporter substrate binding protein, partial [Xanthobacteraceae bacterium]|nr:tripartite tricarboxylate transporter substrate binding protein [Xanthobacteraceae bacterium]
AAQDKWPERPINLVVGFGAGGGTDIIARIVATALNEELGQPVVVVNRPGAGGTVAAESVARAAPDGYTMFMANNGHAISAVTYKSLKFDAVKDFQPVSLVATLPLIIVSRPDFPAKTAGDLIKNAKANPGKLNFASVSVGSTQHFAGALFSQLADIKVTHVPYQKTPEAVAATRSGEADYLVEVLSPVLGQVKSGEMKALAVTSAERYPGLPDVPTVAESGLKEYDVTTWYGFNFPAGTPKPIVDKMNAAIQKVLAKKSVQEQAMKAAFVLKGSTPDAFGKHVASEVERWGKVMKEAGIPQR